MSVVGLQCVVFLGIVLWHELHLETADTWIEIVVATGRGFEPFIFIALFNSLLIVEGGPKVLAELSKKKHIAEAKAERDQEWVSWLERKQQTEDSGQPFNEPNPDEKAKLVNQ
jgi:hypothetical protein